VKNSSFSLLRTPFRRPAGLGLIAAAVLLGACGSAPEPETVQKPPAEAKPAPPKVTQFYASPGVVVKGEEVTMCYGVENTDQVRIEPHIRDIKPARNRCFSFAPEKTAIYKLVAAGPGGEASAELAIKVEPAQPDPSQRASLITAFLASSTRVPKGSPVTICYSVNEVDSISLDPPLVKLDAFSKCFHVRVEETTTFTITAKSGRRTERKSITITAE